VSCAPEKVLELQSWNWQDCWSECTVTHLGICLWIISVFIVIALDLVKISNFELVSYFTQKVFYNESWNFTEMLVSMYILCTWGFALFSICRVIALSCNFQLALNSCYDIILKPAVQMFPGYCLLFSLIINRGNKFKHIKNFIVLIFGIP
jgi:hypothetical protein